MTESVNESVTEVFVEQPLASPRSANKIFDQIKSWIKAFKGMVWAGMQKRMSV